MSTNNFYYIPYEGPETFCMSCGKPVRVVEKMKNDSNYSRKLCGAAKCAAASPVHFEQAMTDMKLKEKQ